MKFFQIIKTCIRTRFDPERGSNLGHHPRSLSKFQYSLTDLNKNLFWGLLQKYKNCFWRLIWWYEISDTLKSDNLIYISTLISSSHMRLPSKYIVACETRSSIVAWKIVVYLRLPVDCMNLKSVACKADAIIGVFKSQVLQLEHFASGHNQDGLAIFNVSSKVFHRQYFDREKSKL